MLSPVAFASRRISCVAGLLSCAFRKPGEKKDWNTRSGAEPWPPRPVISMVIGPGNYSQRDLWRLGLPLSLLYTAVIVLMVNLLW